MVHSAGLVLRSETRSGSDRYLILLARWGNAWSFPKGHRVSDKESVLSCALRETFEETGFSQEVIVLEDREPVTVSYALPKKTKNVPDGVKVVQLFYAFVRDCPVPTLSREHVQFKWASRKSCLRLLRPELASVLL